MQGLNYSCLLCRTFYSLHIFTLAFIIFDTQMIMTRVSPEDYIMATIQLYLDIINLFIEILRILNHANRR